MSDLIYRQAAIDAAIEAVDDWNGGTNIGRQKRIEKYINALPPARTEIIQCKDCRYNNDCEIQYSAQSGDEFFCGCAERKDNG